MSYKVHTSRAVEKQLLSFPDDVIMRLLERIETLSQTPRPHGAKKLSDRESYRVRVDDYRIIYNIDDDAKLVTLRDISHRKDAYR